jgi:peptide deformylase
MAVRRVLKLGNPTLRKKSLPVEESEVGTKEFKKLIGDLFDTMRFEKGVGLAAPQIGVLKRIVVVGKEEENERYPDTPKIIDQILINPVIIPMGPPKDGFWEGCLSLPGMRGYVERPAKIKLEYYDEKWKFHSQLIEDFNAIVYQHECDHLDGVLYIDRIKDPKMFGYTDEIETKGKELD